VTSCSVIVDKDMCLTEGAAGNKKCFWLSDSTNTPYGGRCRDTADSNLLCSDVVDISECTDANLKDTTLDGKCGDYGGVCKTKCERLTDSGTCAASDARSGDCFEVKKEDGTFKECINQVC
jgi:hypothetical protein